MRRRCATLLAAKGDKLFASRRERASVEAFYQTRSYLPLWLDRGVETARAKAAVARLKSAGADGLDPADYKTPSLSASGLSASGSAELAADASAEAELKLTAAVLTYARHVQAGRFPYTRVSRNIELPQAPPEPADILGRMTEAADAGKALDAFGPQQEPYRRLKAMLAELRARPASKETHAQIDTVLANMERWRWYPRDLGKAHVLVNQPDFTLKVMHNGAAGVDHPHRDRQAQHADAAAERNHEIHHHQSDLARAAIDRAQRISAGAGAGPDRARPHGAARELQRRRRLDHACRRAKATRSGASASTSPTASLSISTTPRTNIMFGHDVRAESHGCMRVQDPAKYAEVLLNIARPDEHWTAEKISSMFGSSEQDIQLQPAPIWVHLTYQTAFVDDAGKLQMRRDVYNLDSRTLAAIRSERGTVEPASERKREEIASRSTRRSAAARSASDKPAAPATLGPRPADAFGYAGPSYAAPSYGRGQAPRVYR